MIFIRWFIHIFSKLKLKHLLIGGSIVTLTTIIAFFILAYGEATVTGYIRSLMATNVESANKTTGKTDQDLTFLRIYSGPPSDATYALAGTISAGISRPPGSSPCDESGICGVPGLVAVAQSTAGPIENINLLRKGLGDSAILPIDLAYYAFKGSGLFQGEPPLDIRTVSVLAPLVLQVVVRADGKLFSLKDLKYKRLNLGAEGGSAKKLAQIMLRAVGINSGEYSTISLADGPALDALHQGMVDAVIMLSPPPSRVLQEMGERLPLRFLPINPEIVTQLKSLNPYVSDHLLSQAHYPTLEQPIPTLEIDQLWVVNADLPLQLVEAITKALWHGQVRQLMAIDLPNTELPDYNRNQNLQLIPLHQGAIQFFD